MKQASFEAPFPEGDQGPVQLCLSNTGVHLSVGGSPLLFMLPKGTHDLRDDTGVLQGSGVP